MPPFFRPPANRFSTLPRRAQAVAGRWVARGAIALGVLMGAGAAQAQGQAPTQPDPALIDPSDRGQGTAVIIGGNLKSDHQNVWKRIVALAGGPGARFVVLSTSANNPVKAAEQAADQLRSYGAVPDILPVSPLLKEHPIAQAVKDPALIARIRVAKGVFFTGGLQERYIDHLFPGGRATPLLQAIWEVYRKGGVLVGTSAGAAIMSTTMFRDAPSVVDVLKGRWRDGKEVDRGLGFVGPNIFVDQHFLKRGRIGRMLPLMVAKGYQIGLGIEENAAAAVRGDEVEVLGGNLMFVDLANATRDPKLGAFNIAGVQLSLLDDGDRLNLRTRELTPSESKRKGQRLEPGAPDYKPYYTLETFTTDIFGDNVISVAMGHLIDGTYPAFEGIAFDPRPKADDPLGSLGFQVRVSKGPGSIGWYTEATGGEDYTIHKLRMDIKPIRVPQPLYAPWGGAPAQPPRNSACEPPCLPPASH